MSIENVVNHPIGFYIGQLENNLGYSLPLIFPDFIGGVNIIFDEESENIASQLIENMVLQFIIQLPIGDVKIEAFDFSTRNRFPSLSQFKTKGIYNLSNDDKSGLEKFTQIQAIATKRHHEILDFAQPNIVLYNSLNKYKEKYYILLINFKYFPYSFQTPIILKDFFDAAWSAGIYVIAYGDKDTAKEQFNANKFLFNYLPTVEVFQQQCKVFFHPFIDKLIDLVNYGNFKIKPNISSTENLIQTILDQLKNNDKNTEKKDFLSVKIGMSIDEKTPMYFSMGEKSDVYNAIITGRAGSGKTTLLNNLILGIAEKYDASLLRLYLMDYKQGVEFGDFENHPNCERIFLDNSDIGAAHKLIDDFVSLIEKRGQILRKAGVRNIYEYNKLNSEKMYWVVLIIDEVQRLFDGNWGEQDKFNAQLIRVVREGRAFGIHIILSTQTLVGVNIHDSIMSQITLRISLKLNSLKDAEKTFTYNNYDALKLEQFEFIYNTAAGLREFNSYGRINYISTNIIRKTLKEIENNNNRLKIKPVVVTSHICDDIIQNAEISSIKIDKEMNFNDDEKEEIYQQNEQYSLSLNEDKERFEKYLQSLKEKKSKEGGNNE